MTHPLITFLKTPMAAPETRTLRRMRRLWMALCWSLALAVLLLPLLKVLLGPWAAFPALLLTAAVVLHGFIYFRAKARADDAFGLEVRP
ncbi:hypothetical protein [Novosphingobium sp. LASN5T]|uniref:hypothetical protein n=1 Tax=Novosphingobium sp. LASN5T TaxID=2491021 RepID=UPI000F5D824D|nr:hypothetical protein [Novosphingobium sp. LASN5T]RQW41820.1 hypothetical protein EH199_18850 [Novosphingobium sp. LASN5T]